MLVSRDEFSNKMVLFNEHLFICISMINQQVGDKPYKIQGIDVRGKTQTIAAFDDPEIAIVVMVENGGHGNYTAEVVRDIMSEYFGMNTKDVQEDISAKAYTQFEL